MSENWSENVVSIGYFLDNIRFLSVWGITELCRLHRLPKFSSSFLNKQCNKDQTLRVFLQSHQERLSFSRFDFLRLSWRYRVLFGKKDFFIEDFRTFSQLVLAYLGKFSANVAVSIIVILMSRTSW